MTLTDITTTSVTISWLASASDGGSSIRYYQVLMYVPPPFEPTQCKEPRFSL
jgi:hypothetical protein